MAQKPTFLRLIELELEEEGAWEALLNDPRVLADPEADHTPELLEAWEKAADALREYRRQFNN